MLLWVECVVGRPLMDENMHEALMSGEVLCDLVNTLQPDLVRSPASQRKSKRVSSNVAAAHGENILNYLEACKQASPLQSFAAPRAKPV